MIDVQWYDGKFLCIVSINNKLITLSTIVVVAYS